MNPNLDNTAMKHARNFGNYTKEAVKAFQIGIVSEENFIEKVQDNLPK